MKIILVGLLITILAVQQSSSKPCNSAQCQHSEQQAPQISVKYIENRLEDKFRKLYQDIDRLGGKFAALQRMIAAEEPEDLTTFEAPQTTIAAEKSANLPKFEKIGSKYYYIEHTDKVNWRDASSKCRAMGGSLVVLKYVKQVIDISEKLANNNYWIGQSDCVNLAKLASNYERRYNDCESKLGFVCEKDAAKDAIY